MSIGVSGVVKSDLDNKSIKVGSFSSGLNGKYTPEIYELKDLKNGEIENVNFDDNDSETTSHPQVVIDPNVTFGVDVNHEAIPLDSNNTTSDNSTFDDILGYILNGSGLASISVGGALASTNPVLASVLTVLGVGATFASDDFEMNANSWYGLASCTPMEQGIVDYLSGSLITSGISIIDSSVYGSIALTLVNAGVQIASGASVAEVLDKAPQTILESTVWVITDTCVTAIASTVLGPQLGKMVGSSAASVASNLCTEPFKDENGNVQQDWCIAAEVGVLGGVAAGGYIAAAAGVAAACPVAAIVLGCAALGYFAVVGVKELIDYANSGGGANIVSPRAEREMGTKKPGDTSTREKHGKR